MKKYLLLICILLSNSTYAQVSLDSSNLVFAGQFINNNRAANTLGISYNQTGTNQIWDYSQLSPASTFTDTFTAALNAPATMLLFFLFTSNIASPDQGNVGTWNFYRKSATRFQQNGTASEAGGVAIPLLYSSADVIYRFPLQYGNMDSCTYNFSLPTGGQGFGIRENRKRINTVDGWGSLKIPNKTFDNVLRIHSKLLITDSISLDSLGTSFNTTLRTQHEYKFLAKGYDWPVLAITTTEIFGFQIVNSVVYRNMPVVMVPNGINEAAESAIKVSPNPFSNQIEIFNNQDFQHVRVYNMQGAQVYAGRLSAGQNVINNSHWSPGSYVILFDNNQTSKSLLITKN